MHGISAAPVTAVLQIPDLGFLLCDCHSPPIFWLCKYVFWQNETTSDLYYDPLSGQTKDEIHNAQQIYLKINVSLRLLLLSLSHAFVFNLHISMVIYSNLVYSWLLESSSVVAKWMMDRRWLVAMCGKFTLNKMMYASQSQ